LKRTLKDNDGTIFGHAEGKNYTITDKAAFEARLKRLSEHKAKNWENSPAKGFLDAIVKSVKKPE
jgi:hypothetical protein